MSDEGRPPSSNAGGSRSPGSSARARLAALRADGRRRTAALAVALVAGLALATVHWLGLVAAGALVGLTRRTLPRAAAAGVVVGLAALAGTVVTTPGLAPTELLRLAPASYVTLAAALLAPVWGSLARGVV